MTYRPLHAAPIGWWRPGNCSPEIGSDAVDAVLFRLNQPVCLIDHHGKMAVGKEGTVILGDENRTFEKGFPVIAYAPALPPHLLGDPSFKQTHGLTYAYVMGAMANGITSVEMVEAAGRAGMIGFFGAAGLGVSAIEAAADRLQKSLPEGPFGMNLIHSPNDPDLEMATVLLYLKKGIRRISASAYLGVTLPLVYYRVAGIRRDVQGRVICPNHVVGKVSRVEVAERFLSPPPEKILRQLVAQNKITPEQAELAGSIPVAGALTAEADSGGHTDNRPAISLLPTFISLRDRMMERYRYSSPICVGLGGGIATPASAAGAFAMGAGYVLTGSINQSCVEAGTSPAVREMLAQARQADVAMAPSADMFEMGVKVQVLKRGTMFAMRASRLYELYAAHERYDDIPETHRALLEKDYFRTSFEKAWQSTRMFFAERDPRQIERAEKDPKHKMALVFRAYLGQASKWAITGDPSRQMDYQIWCGPAMGAFNEWVRDTFLEKPDHRDTVTVAMNLLFGAALITRVNCLKHQGIELPSGIGRPVPLPLDAIHQALSHAENQVRRTSNNA